MMKAFTRNILCSIHVVTAKAGDAISCACILQSVVHAHAITIRLDAFCCQCRTHCTTICPNTQVHQRCHVVGVQRLRESVRERQMREGRVWTRTATLGHNYGSAAVASAVDSMSDAQLEEKACTFLRTLPTRDLRHVGISVKRCTVCTPDLWHVTQVLYAVHELLCRFP